MKKLIFTFATVLCLFTSCSNTDESQQVTPISKISAVLLEENYDAQKLMYNMLSAAEKFTLWNNKIDKIIQSNILTTEQLNLMYELKNNLTVNLFSNAYINDEKEVFKTIFLKQFLKKTINVFTEDFMKDNFFNISARTIYITAEPGDADSGDVGCSCNKTSYFSCVLKSNTCKSSNNCTSTNSGCGFMGFSGCDGRCYFN